MEKDIVNEEELVKSDDVLDHDMVVSMELTYPNVLNMLLSIEKEHGKQKAKFIKYDEKTKVSKKPVWNRKKLEVSYIMDALSVQYCEILKVAYEKDRFDSLMKEPWLNKWWAEQVESLKNLLKEQTTQTYDDQTSEELSTGLESIIQKATPVESNDFSKPFEVLSPVESVGSTIENISTSSSHDSEIEICAWTESSDCTTE